MFRIWINCVDDDRLMKMIYLLIPLACLGAAIIAGFWGNKIALSLNKSLETHKNRAILNLASVAAYSAGVIDYNKKN